MRGSRRYARVIASAGAVLIAFGALTLTPTTVKAQDRALSAVEMDEEFVRLWNASSLAGLAELDAVANASGGPSDRHGLARRTPRPWT